MNLKTKTSCESYVILQYPTHLGYTTSLIIAFDLHINHQPPPSLGTGLAAALAKCAEGRSLGESAAAARGGSNEAAQGPCRRANF